MRALRVVSAVSLLLVLVSGCSRSDRLPDPADPAVKAAEARLLPDRSKPAVKAEEARLAKTLGADRSINGEPGNCKVRLMGQKAGASFVWAFCTATAPVEPGASEHSAASVPVRVDGARVTLVGGIGPECPGLYKIFPKDLADLVCKYGYNGHELFGGKS
jgi:hypothetical protein